MSDIPSPIPTPEPVAQQPALIEAAAQPSAATVAARSALAVRIWCAFALAIAIGMLGVGLILTPSPDGLGTHRELGLPPCGWYSQWGFPCPTCGCTTAVSYLAHGRPVRSFLTQPFGFAVGMAALILIPFAGIGLFTGKWRGPTLFSVSVYWQRWLWAFIAILVLGWIYKIISMKYGV